MYICVGPLMTGCKEQYTIRVDDNEGKCGCYSKYNPQVNVGPNMRILPKMVRWAPGRALAWRKVGGGGGMDLDLTTEELFLRKAAWDKQSYFVVGAGTRGTTDKHSIGGLVDNHAYSVIETHSNVAGTECRVDLVKVRNPWGKAKIENGEFDNGGTG